MKLVKNSVYVCVNTETEGIYYNKYLGNSKWSGGSNEWASANDSTKYCWPSESIQPLFRALPPAPKLTDALRDSYRNQFLVPVENDMIALFEENQLIHPYIHKVDAFMHLKSKTIETPEPNIRIINRKSNDF